MSARGRAARRVFMNIERVEQSLLNYFRSHVNDRCRHYAKLILLAKARFLRYSSELRFQEMFLEMQFSFFEITQCTEYGVIRSAFQNFMGIKLRKRMTSQMSLAQFDIFENSDPGNIPNMMDLFYGQTGDYVLYSPDLLLNLEVTSRFLRYGARFEMSSDQIVFCLDTMLLNFGDYVAPSAFQMDVTDEMESEMRKTVYRAYPTLERQERLFIVLLLLYVTLRKQEIEADPEYRDAARSVKLLLQTIEEPFVTVSEISRYLNLVVTCDNKERKIEETCKRFVEEFPNAQGCMAPRSLKHLSRCQVRKCMGKSRTLPHGVCDLGIPKNLQNYILIQKTNEDPKYVAALAASKRSVKHERSTAKS